MGVQNSQKSRTMCCDGSVGLSEARDARSPRTLSRRRDVIRGRITLKRDMMLRRHVSFESTCHLRASRRRPRLYLRKTETIRRRRELDLIACAGLWRPTRNVHGDKTAFFGFARKFYIISVTLCVNTGAMSPVASLQRQIFA